VDPKNTLSGTRYRSEGLLANSEGEGIEKVHFPQINNLIVDPWKMYILYAEQDFFQSAYPGLE